MEEKLLPEYFDLIKEIKEPCDPIVDSFGRVTFFYIMLGDQQLPIYQPGSIMFETAVNGESDISVVHGGSQ